MNDVITNKEQTNADFLLTIISYHRYMNKASKTTVNAHDNYQNEFPFRPITIVPHDLHQIKPRATQVWVCDEIGFDTDGKWHNVLCTYKFFQGSIMWRMQTGERAPFWCTLLIFTRVGGQCFMRTIIVHQSKEYSQDLNHNIPLDCTVHNTPSGYMDRDGLLKAMTQLSNICGASPFNNQILFFDEHNSHFDKRLPTKHLRKTSSPSYLNMVSP